MTIIERGEDLILRNPDPAINKVKGYRRYLVGFDIGQAKDPSAYTVIKDERLPEYGPNGHQQLGERKREIVTADRIPSMSYTDLAQVARNLTRDPAIHGRAYMAVDASGVGRAFCDILNTKSVPHVRVQMTGGDAENEVKEQGRTFSNVGKARLLSALNSALHTGELRMGNFAARSTLQEELESFEAEITAAGRTVIDGGTGFGHADIAVSAALAFWLSDHRSVGTMIGEVPLRGYW